MPLYECTRCHAVDNTALTNFWCDTTLDGKPALCSECDPEIGGNAHAATFLDAHTGLRRGEHGLEMK